MVFDKHGTALAPGDLVTVTARVEAVGQALNSNDAVISVQTYPDPVQYSDGLTVTVNGLAVEKTAP